MTEYTFEIETYDVDLHPVPSGGSTRSLRLEGAGGDGTRNVAFLNFYPPSQYLRVARLGRTEETVSVTANVLQSEFDQFYHALQTEDPVYLYAQYEGDGGPIYDLEVLGITTELEMVGEGFTDTSP